MRKGSLDCYSRKKKVILRIVNKVFFCSGSQHFIALLQKHPCAALIIKSVYYATIQYYDIFLKLMPVLRMLRYFRLNTNQQNDFHN